MKNLVTLGIDVGTSSSKGVLVSLDGELLGTATREHEAQRPQPGFVEMSAEIWWDEFVSISRELLTRLDVAVVAVGVSGMGPCVLLTDATGAPLRPAILYGVDTRATTQIERITVELGGAETISARCGSQLSTQSVGPKIAWIAEHEAPVLDEARRLYMPSSWLVWNLTGNYVLDHHSASQSTPMYDVHKADWHQPWTQHIAPRIELPELLWPGDIAGRVTEASAALTGIPAGTPVVAGTIDAWSEAVSVGAWQPGDLMLMYGTTMFLIATVAEPLRHPALWGTTGTFPGTHCLAGGMATGGAVLSWVRDLTRVGDHGELTALAQRSGQGASGLLMLPYFAGERTPIADPFARGVIVGLTLDHGAGDLYRAALESVAFGVRHNIEAMRHAGAEIRRVIAVGGGAQSALFTQIVSDVTGCEQIIPTHTIGASLGAAFLAANAVGHHDITSWNPPAQLRKPEPHAQKYYDAAYHRYLALYPATAEIAHALAVGQG